MQTGAITNYIDVAQLMLYAFWIFFAGLVIYLRREDKREGYPLESDRSGRIRVQGFPAIPRPKYFKLAHGGSVRAPSGKSDTRTIAAKPIGGWLGAPLAPTGNPMLDGVGPASYAERADVPDQTVEGQAKIVPLRAAPGFHLEARDPDPRGMAVIGGDGEVGGTIADVWVDRSETLLRYFEVEVKTASGTRRVLVPTTFTKVNRRKRQVNVKSIFGKHFATVPGLRNPDQVTLLEEDRIAAYYAGGTLYAEPSRLGPKL